MQYTKGAPCEALVCDFLSHNEGFALQGSFLLPFKSSFAWSHAEDQRGESLILGGLLHPVAASLVLLVSTRPTLALCARMARIQRGQDGH